MKKIIYILAALTALVACAKEANIVEENVPEEIKTTGKTVSFTVAVEKQDTKSTLSSEGFAWEASDRAAVFTTGGEKVILTPSSINGSKAVFSGTITDDNDGIPEGAIIVYPEERLKDATTITFPNTYDKPEDTKGPVLAAQVGSDRTTLAFKYVCQTIEFTITDIPSVATSLVMQTNPGLWGESTISFDGSGNPSIIGVPGNEIIISLPASGSKTFRIPLPAATSFNCWMYLKKDYGILFEKTNFNTPSTTYRNSYFKLKDLSINPNVYLVRNLDGDHWSDDNATKQTTLSGTTYSEIIKSFGGSNKYFRYDVQYPDATIAYGNSDADVDGLSGGTFISDATNSALLPVYGLNEYTITFDYITGNFTVDKNPINLYLIGINNDWSFDKTKPLTRVVGDYYCWTGSTTHDKVKIYEEGITNWDNGGTYPSSDISVSTGTISFFVNSSDISSNNFCQTEFKKSTVVLKGAFDEWGDGVGFAKTAHNGLWMIATKTFNSDAEAKIVVDGSYTGTGEASGTIISGNRIYDLSTLGSGNNFKIAKGTYKIAYNDNTNTLYFEKL